MIYCIGIGSYQNFKFYAVFDYGFISIMFFKNNFLIKISSCSYLYPARMFSNEVFPAPEGPIIAVNCPDRNDPLTPRNITFLAVNKLFMYQSLMQMNH